MRQQHFDGNTPLANRTFILSQQPICTSKEAVALFKNGYPPHPFSISRTTPSAPRSRN
jgi:hypothetical protein